jgi:ribonuclease VapC
VDAWLRFGKGRHFAALNFGDCLSYATAVITAEPLLCIGDDFPQTVCLLA